MVSYGMNPVDLFEANDLFESGNMTQVQVSLLALAGKVRLGATPRPSRIHRRPWSVPLPTPRSTQGARRSGLGANGATQPTHLRVRRWRGGSRR